MPISPDTRDRLTASVAQLVRTGRHVSTRAAAQLYGDLPSFGWALLAARSSRTATSAAARSPRAAGVDVSVASRQLAVLERAGYVERRPDPRDGRASLLRLTAAGRRRARRAPARCAREWALAALVRLGRGRRPAGSPTCSTASWPTSRPAVPAPRTARPPRGRAR